MRFITLIFLLSCICSQAQELQDSIPEHDPGDTLYSWPYVKRTTPPFIGILAGGDLYADRSIEVGVIVNLTCNHSNINGGAIYGPSISYKRFFEKDLHALQADIGFYGALAAGIGINYIFNNSSGLLGINPFLGLAFYHVQLSYGYNFFREKNDRLGLKHSQVTLRITIPLIELFKNTD